MDERDIRATLATVPIELARTGSTMYLQLPIPVAGSHFNFSANTIMQMSASQKLGMAAKNREPTVTL